MHTVVAAAVAYIAGAFTPSIGRKIKSYFVKEADAAKTAVESDVSSAVKKL
jgi:hypothetical protein